MQSQTQPLASCLMVTRQRLTMAKRAIDCFANQGYPHRELVIVSDGHEEYDELRRYASDRCDGGLTCRAFERGALSLGALRNAAIQLARGEIICQWDDDDFSHAERVSTQIASLLEDGADACFLTDQLLLMTRTNSLYWCDWMRPAGAGVPYPTIPNTLVCKKHVAGQYPEAGPLSRRSEDACFMRALLRQVKVSRLSGHAWLYVYVSHGMNTWHESHHLDIIRATGLESRDLLHRRHALTNGLAQYALGELIVRDRTGAEVYRIGSRAGSC
jgi:glycosyltransferase involved in cell wall biosynthesis